MGPLRAYRHPAEAILDIFSQMKAYFYTTVHSIPSFHFSFSTSARAILIQVCKVEKMREQTQNLNQKGHKKKKIKWRTLTVTRDCANTAGLPLKKGRQQD